MSITRSKFFKPVAAGIVALLVAAACSSPETPSNEPQPAEVSQPTTDEPEPPSEPLPPMAPPLEVEPSTEVTLTADERAQWLEVSKVYTELDTVTDPSFKQQIAKWWKAHEVNDIIAPVELPQEFYTQLSPEGQRVADRNAAEYRAKRDAEYARLEAEKQAQDESFGTFDSVDSLIAQGAQVGESMAIDRLPGWGPGNLAFPLPIPNESGLGMLFEVDCSNRRSQVYGVMDLDRGTAYPTEVSKQLIPEAADDFAVWEYETGIVSQMCG